MAAVLLLFILPPLWAQDDGRLFPVRVEESWGYMDSDGEVVIDPIYEEANHFSDGLGRVLLDGTIRFVDASGTEVLNTGMRAVGDFSEGLAPFSRAGEDAWGYLDREGEVAIEPAFSEVYAFSEGLAAVNTSFGSGASASWGYIDQEGNVAVEPRFHGARQFSEGLAPVLVGGFVDGTWGYINPSGELEIDPRFDEGLPFSEGLAAVDTAKEFGEEAYGYIDRSGALVIDPEYVLAQRFSGGVAPVAIIDRDNWAYIDTEGEPISRERWAFAEPFRGGLARVAEEAGSPGFGHSGGKMDYYVSPEEWLYIDSGETVVWPRPEGAPSGEGQADDSSATEQAPGRPEEALSILPKGTLGDLLPSSLEGLSLQGQEGGSRTMHAGVAYPELWATYGGEEGDLQKVQLYLAYGAMAQLMTQEEIVEAPELGETAVRGERVFFLEQEEGAVLVAGAFPGRSALLLRAEYTEGSAPADVSEKILPLFDSLPVEELRALGLGEVETGYRRYTGRFMRHHLSVIYPETWQPVDFYEANGMTPMIGFSRRSIDALRLLANQRELVLPEEGSGYVTVAAFELPFTAAEYAEEALEGTGITIEGEPEGPSPIDSETIPEAEEVVEVTASGHDGGGRPVEYRLIVGTVQGIVVSVAAVTPEGNGFRRDQLDQLLSSISITAQ